MSDAPPARATVDWKRCAATDAKGRGIMRFHMLNVPDVLVVLDGPAKGHILENVSGIVAVANDALPDNDPRKITAARIAAVRAALAGDAASRPAAESLLAGLEALLPPV